MLAPVFAVSIITLMVIYGDASSIICFGIAFAIPRIAPKISTYSMGNSEKANGPRLKLCVPINSATNVRIKASR